jgi:predicted short-subunit dehydrogenase-like oxidoreductase (DUF2520 family)
MNRYKISFIGAGNLACGLCLELYKTGYVIRNIISQEGKSAASLAQKCKSLWSDELLVPDEVDILIVAVPDHKLQPILEKVQSRDDIVIVHTAGSLGLDVFPERFNNTGVIYPLMTFSKNRELNFRDIPFFIESSNPQTGLILESIVNQIGKSVRYSDTNDRRMLHLAAVFVNNFTNLMLTGGKEIAEMAGFSFEELIPLMNETMKKASEIGPENAQTGPATRNDRNTIEKHLELLSFSPELRRIYLELSNSIIKRYKK